MGCITGFILFCNIAFLIAMDAYMWTLSTQLGVFGLLGIIGFFIGYALSVEITIAPRDFWVNPYFDIFIKKLTFANIVALVVWGGAVVIATLLGSDVAFLILE